MDIYKDPVGFLGLIIAVAVFGVLLAVLHEPQLMNAIIASSRVLF